MKKKQFILVMIMLMSVAFSAAYSSSSLDSWRDDRMTPLVYLQERITENDSLAEIVDAFEQMCKIPIEDDLLLFETGTFDFSGVPLFYFSLVRQFPNEVDEFYQIHVDVMYNPSKDNSIFSKAVWNDAIDEDFFSYIRSSPAYLYAKNEEYTRIDLYIDET